jgi:signal peptidase I
MKYLITLVFLLLFNMDALAKDQTQLFGYYTNRVASSDMVPTLLAGEFIFSDSNYYNENPIVRGDIVLFNSPKKEGVVWVKRVVGLPGETVTVKSGKTYINSKPYVENYVDSDNNKKVSLKMNRSISLTENEYYLMGDNRDNSYDSRFLGPILRSDILAKTRGIYFSKKISRIGKVK